MTEPQVEERRTGLPDWKRMGRPQRIERNVDEHDPRAELIADLVCSEAWSVYLAGITKEAKPIHKLLVGGNYSSPEVGTALAASLAILWKTLAPMYERAKMPVPEYLRVLLTGAFDE